MTRIEIKYVIRLYSEEDLDLFNDRLQEIKGFCFNGVLLKHKTQFTIDYYSEEKRRHSDGGLYIKKLKEYLEKYPDDMEVRERLNLKLNEQEIYYDFTICCYTDIEAEISIDDNIVVFPDDKVPTLEEIVKKDLCLRFCYNSVDEEFVEEITQYGRAVFLSILFTYDELFDYFPYYFSAFIDGRLVKKENTCELGYLSDLAESKYENLIQTRITFSQCWKWIEQNTSLCGIKERSPIYISALFNALNREENETVLYLCIAIENLFINGNNNISSQLQKRIGIVIPQIDQKAIKKIYNLRSKLVHGERTLSILASYKELENDPERDEAIQLLFAVLIETIKKLINSNATEIELMEKITFQYR